jgi:hypothetical protein
MASKEHKEKLNDFFKNYPKDDECVITSDGQIFQKKASIWAKRHAEQNGLKLDTAQRSGKEKPSDSETAKDSDGALPDFSQMTKAELNAFATENDIEVDEKGTNAEIVDKIESHLEKNFDPETIKDSYDEFKPTQKD